MFEPLTAAERAEYRAILHDLIKDKHAKKMQEFIQHGAVTTYQHCLSVAEISFWLKRRLGWDVDENSLVRGAFLHDFYLYDWHDPNKAVKWHGFNHPAVACQNADRIFHLNPTERDIIQNHMWPLTLRHMPHSREAVLVCIADKICSAHETLLQRRTARTAPATAQNHI